MTDEWREKGVVNRTRDTEVNGVVQMWDGQGPLLRCAMGVGVSIHWVSDSLKRRSRWVWRSPAARLGVTGWSVLYWGALPWMGVGPGWRMQGSAWSPNATSRRQRYIQAHFVPKLNVNKV